MIDLSFYHRTDMLRDPIHVKDAPDIYARGQSAATLILVALAAGAIVLLVWGAK
jgi:hypothetical protein